jgi:T4 superinfection immunity protein
MFFLMFCGLMYFLPSILGHNKRPFAGIFLLNFFLGWTVIGWICALVWACAAEPRIPVYVVPGQVRHCCRCGATAPGVAHFCWACGAHV